MPNPLVGTEWTVLPIGSTPVYVINSDVAFAANWPALAGVSVPAANYIFKYGSNRSEYLLVGIKAEDEGVFFNITKANAIKYLPLDDGLLVLKTAQLFDGTITQPYGGQQQANPTPMPAKKATPAANVGQILVTGTAPNLYKKAPAPSIMKKIITPKRTCGKCGAGMTLLFTSFSCDKGCR